MRIPRWPLVWLIAASAALVAPDAFAQPTSTAPPWARCAACHGSRGQGAPGGAFPSLAGLPQRYLAWQLRDFASGRRVSTVMQSMAKALSAAQITQIARHYAHLPAPPAPATLGKDTRSRGARIATQGAWRQGVPACALCHGERGQGVGTRFPRLAGQPASYLSAQLHVWQKGQRAPGPLGLMQHVANHLDAADITAVADYFAGAAPPTSPPTTPAHAATAKHPALTVFVPPALSTIPAGPFGDAVRRGYRIFTNTPANAGKYIGNRLSCVNCHLDAGRLANAAPLWAAYVAYPAYRSKTHRINTYGQRLQGCFRFSMNGKAPPLDGGVITALESYSFWMTKGAPVDTALAGRGYPKLPPPAQAPDYQRGQGVYTKHCALCHQGNGAGLQADGHTQFPALWGSDSYNWGAGMANVNTAADFIHANMPLGIGGSLSTQQAWDVALYVDSHERPQDPRYAGSIATTRKRFHATPYSMYGRVVNGHRLGRGTPR